MARNRHSPTRTAHHATFTALVCWAIGGAAPAQAQQIDVETAALNLGLAVKICLTNYRTPGEFQNAFTGAGFTIAPGIDSDVYDLNGYGVWGLFNETTGLCNIQSEAVPLETTQPLIRDLAEQLFPGQVQPGAPEGANGPCDGISIFAPQKLLWVRYSQAGNSGECIFDGTSAVVVN